MKTFFRAACVSLLVIMRAAAQEEETKGPDAELIAQAEAEYEAKNYPAAAELCKEIIQKYPNHEMVQTGAIQLRLIWSLCYDERYDEAAREAKKFVESFPEHKDISSAYYILGIGFERLGEAGEWLDKAREAYEKALETEKSPRMIKLIKGRLDTLNQKVTDDARSQRELAQSNPDRTVIIPDPLPSEEGLPRKAKLGAYIILTDLSEDDPYYEAVAKLAKIRKVEAILHFVPDNLGDLSERLKEASPEFVCVVTKPATIDANFVCHLLELSANLDSDPFPDFLFGIITGNSAQDAAQFVKNISRADKRRLSFPKQILSVSKGGSSELRTASYKWATGFSSLTIHYAEHAFLSQHLDKLKGNSIIAFTSSGSREGAQEGISSADLAGLDLYPAIVFSSEHYTGATSRVLSINEQSGTITAQEADPNKPSPLSIIASGAVGYFAPVGPGNQTVAPREIQELICSGESLGRVIKNTHDGVVLARRESVLAFPPLVPGEGRSTETPMDVRVHAAASRVFYGDPALKPLLFGIGSPLKLSFKRKPDSLLLTCRRAEEENEAYLLDSYRFGLESEKKRNNDQLRFVFELPKGLDRDIEKIEISNTAKEQEYLKPGFVTCILEKWGGKKFIHFQMDFPPSSIRDKAFAFDISFDLKQ